MRRVPASLPDAAFGGPVPGRPVMTAHRGDFETGALAGPPSPWIPIIARPRPRALVWLAHHRGTLAVALCLALTTGLWVLGKRAAGWPGDMLPWRGACQLTILWSLTLMALSLVVGTRARALEPLFGGLDQATELHRAIGPLSIALMAIHVALLIPIWQAQGEPVARIFIPFVWGPLSDFDIFTVATWSFLALTVVVYLRRLSHEVWKVFHVLFGVAFLISAYPSLLMPGSISAFEPLRFWMGLLTLAGTLAMAYRLLAFRRLGPRHRYRAVGVTRLGSGAYDLELRPTNRRLSYAPGNFVFIGLPGHRALRRQLHPFSLSSSPASSHLRLSIRAVGDFTRALREIPRGGAVDVYGPFGGLTTHALSHCREIICVGAGIGVTPFLGMARADLTDDHARDIRLIYIVPDAKHAPYDPALRALSATPGSRLRYQLWSNWEWGRRFHASDAVAPGRDPAEYGVMLCGTQEFVEDMRRQFLAAGARREHIIGEGFSFR